MAPPITPVALPPLLESVFNHVVLPPRLPGKHEQRIDQVERALADRLLDATKTLRDLTDGQLSDEWENIRGIVQACRTLNAGGKLAKTSLLTEFHNLRPRDVLILHIAEQNAGLLIRWQKDEQGDNLVFESFEASPLSEKVLASQGALIWNFPGSAVTIPSLAFNESSFREELATFLQQASVESIKQFATQTRKAGSFVFESRDTVDPALVTQMLMTLLEVNGRRVFPPLTCKRIRDDVCWTDGAENPWRRSAFWLVLRVGLQRHMSTLLGGNLGQMYYKFLLCVVLAQLLDDSLDDLDPEHLTLLKAKLCRRLVKLEVEKERASSSIRQGYEYMFGKLGPTFYKITRNATQRIEGNWMGFKKTITRPIPRLPGYADKQDLYLTLPKSGPYLYQVLTEALYVDSRRRSFALYELPANYNGSGADTYHLKAFTNHYNSLSELESSIKNSNAVIRDASVNVEVQSVEIAARINVYLSAVAHAYESNAEQKSLMLLTVMELWKCMDECATRRFTLLEDFNPGFPSEILDVLQCSNYQDLCRLEEIQEYIQNRHAKSKFSRMTIFDDPVSGCFAERYFDGSQDTPKLQKLQFRIEAAAEHARQEKQREWQLLSAEYEVLVQKISESTCLFTIDDMQPLIRIHDDRRCTKCFLERKARRMKIQVHEHPLPSNQVQAKSVMFELGCPKAFVAYRDATWKILYTLGVSKHTESRQPQVLLHDYTELRQFMNKFPYGLSLASTTKSFLKTHYSHVSFPVTFDNVCLPNALKYGYFDTITKVWPARQAQKPSFAHHCVMIIPTGSPFASLQFSPSFGIDSPGPSSSEVLASQTKCPSGLNIHEFMAYQALFSGRYRRWLLILIELGSSNLNFSTEATATLISQLALQAGPAHKKDPLRVVHSVFRDAHFCRRLIEQLAQRLKGVSSNWRETHCMEMLITLSLRLCSLVTDSKITNEAIKLLEEARATTFNWLGLLRIERHRARDATTFRNCSRYAFWAALLCRRTFAVYDESDAHMQPAALRCFIECSISLQDNLFGDTAALPRLQKNALIRDVKMVYRMRMKLLAVVKLNPNSLVLAINTVWPEPEGGPSRTFSGFTFLPHPNEWWIQSTVDATKQIGQQIIHFHLLEGHFLIDGQALGKLPPEHMQSCVIKQLFGDQSLLTYPSSLSGMTYTLAYPMYGHQIHLGFRNQKLIVRAYIRGKVLELIPIEIFGSPPSLDLPASLIKDCVHWLDLNTGVMEIRKKPDIWKYKPSNWLLDVRNRSAKRRTVSLVDPYSRVFRIFTQIFGHFEYPYHLTVFQPEKRRLTVELRRLDLSFTVNTKGLLESEQLQSEIDPNQDAGTWYGLNSKIILRDVLNTFQRSIIIPLSLLSYKRNGYHVAVAVENDGSYGRFTINDTLGRLECAAEPRLLYLKALFHAYTSFVVPDPLTKRTGTEEAIHSLRSGSCQPFQPLNLGPHQLLMTIARLTPRREYYPKDLKVMQKTFWNEELPTATQDNAFRLIVEEICRKSEQLSIFALKKLELPPLEVVGDRHLLNRSSIQGRLHQRPDSECDVNEAVSDMAYSSRDRCRTTQDRFNVFETTSLILDWPLEISTTNDLAGVLQNWPTIGGYQNSFDKILLSDRLTVNLALYWGSLVKTCHNFEAKDKFRLMFLLAVISFNTEVDMNMIRVLISFSVFGELKALSLPLRASYIQFRQHQIPRMDYLLQLIKPFCLPYQSDESMVLRFSVNSKKQQKILKAYDEEVENNCKALAQLLLDQWPCAVPTPDGFSGYLFVDVAQALAVILPEWQRLFENLELSHHVQQVQQVLDSHRTGKKIGLPSHATVEQEVFPIRHRGGEFPTLSQDLLCKSGPILSTLAHAIERREITGSVTERTRDAYTTAVAYQEERYDSSREIEELEGIISKMMDSQSVVRQRYGRDLMQSLHTLKCLNKVEVKGRDSIPLARLSLDIAAARSKVRDQFDQLCRAFEQNDGRVPWLQVGGLWPCITPITLLEQLRSKSLRIFGDRMKDGIIMYALSITTLQRLLRINDVYIKGKTQRLLEEQKNEGHQNWQPKKYPDWLLLEIDANILIRPDQIEVAQATISPVSGSNSVLQMNMGQGKTSCIMPMVATVLADTKKLLRVVVPKSLLLQTGQLVHARLGGLVGRELRHVPFSRKTPTDSATIKSLYAIHNSMLKSSGIMLALPEHNLSFLLSGLQRLLDTRIPEAELMIRISNFFRRTCRDVLDECDFTLAVRTQLIYPSGPQTALDGHPHRWETAEALLQLIQGHLWSLQNDFPRSIEVIQRSQGGFPIIFFLRKDVEDALLVLLVDDICCGRTSILPTKDCSQSEILDIKQFISEAKVEERTIERIRQMFSEKLGARQNIYLLRGLLVHRILLLCVRKRWNVAYGLNLNRDPIAVPYNAKGVPSDQAEWGHPDVALLFTCLAFYYTGLSIPQLRQSLENVLQSDDPASEYDRWTHSSGSLPDSLREWNAINIDDESQLMEIWRHVNNKPKVIDYFLNKFVFPKHAKQFRVKLQASGWDVPLLLPDRHCVRETSQGLVKCSQAQTTGFSGTNDNRTMLPLTIKQEDLPGLSHTNAEVLTYLLQTRNRQYVLAADTRGRHLSELDFLHQLNSMRIRVLIDAGAQILEMDNLSLVKAWLTVCPEPPAAVYFNAENKPSVIYRNGHEMPLSATPFAENLDNCLVYLDEAHTRGTDLKLPVNARGALTLGLGQTKDHTVQAAMRLRQLATTQSVVFIAPPEVHQSILDLRKKKTGALINSSDVIYWLLEQTCDGIEQLQPLYYSQGVDFCRRTQAAFENPDFLVDTNQRNEYLGTLRQTEKQTLEELYEDKLKAKSTVATSSLSPRIATIMKELNARKKCFQDSGNAVHGSALQEVEQEREVAFEVEAVREVQKPTHYSPLPFQGLHRDILSFVKTGRLAVSSAGFEQVFVTLRRTSIGLKYGISSSATSSKLYVSSEFTRTVHLPKGRAGDNFQRHVNWVLWSCVTEAALIVIPEEAEILIPLLYEVKEPLVHLITYAAPVARKMLHFNNLTYYAIPTLPSGWEAPAWLKIELGIFAGRLYFEYEEYYDLCKYLGLEYGTKNPIEIIDDTTPTKDQQSDEPMESTMDEVKLGSTAQEAQSFTPKPLSYLQEWLTIRRHGQDFVHTPMGHVCQGKFLTANHPFFTQFDRVGSKVTGVVKGKEIDVQSEHSVEDDSFIDDDGEDEDQRIINDIDDVHDTRK